MILFLSHLRDRIVVSFTEEETNTQGSRSWPKFQLTRAEGRSQARLTPKPNLFPLLAAPDLQEYHVSEAGLEFYFLEKPPICPSFIHSTSSNPPGYFAACAPLISEPAWDSGEQKAWPGPPSAHPEAFLVPSPVDWVP